MDDHRTASSTTANTIPNVNAGIAAGDAVVRRRQDFRSVNCNSNNNKFIVMIIIIIITVITTT